MGRGPVEDDRRTAPPGPSRAMPVTELQPISTGTAPGRPADHDVAGRGALEPERVHEHVEEAGRHGQHGAEQVDGAPEQGEGHDLERDGEGEGGPGRHGAGDQRPALGALHQRGRCRGRRTMLMALAPPAARVPPGHGADHQPERRQPALGHDHRGHGGDEQQLDDPRLGERDVGRDPGAGRQHVQRTRRARVGPAPAPRRTRRRGPSGARRVGVRSLVAVPSLRARLAALRTRPDRAPRPTG